MGDDRGGPRYPENRPRRPSTSRGEGGEQDASSAAAYDHRREIRSPDWHRHLPVHGRRGIDEPFCASSAQSHTRMRSPSIAAPSARRAQTGPAPRDTQGDAFFFAFPSAPEAASRRPTITDSHTSGPISLRVGHTREPARHRRGLRGRRRALRGRVAASGPRRSDPAFESGARSSSTLPVHQPRGTPLQGHLEHGRSISSAKELPSATRRSLIRTFPGQPASSSFGNESARTLWASHRSAPVHAHLARRLRQDSPRPGGRKNLVPSYKAGVFWVGLASLREPCLKQRRSRRRSARRTASHHHIGERETLLLLETWNR